VGSLGGALYALAAGLAVYSLVDLALHLRLSPEEERRGADLSIHKVGAYPESDIIG
jgi:Amt family ammonium transporter